MADPITATFAAIASAATSAAVAVTGSAALAAAIGNAIISTGAFLASWKGALTAASLLGSVLLAPDVNRSGAPTEWRPDTAAGYPIALGRTAFAGRIIHMDAHGNDNRYLTTVSVLSAGGPVSVEAYLADRIPVTFSGAAATSPSAFANKMWRSLAPGLRNATSALALTSLSQNSPGLQGWDSASILPGMAHALITLYNDSKRASYPTGAPVPLWVLLGIPVYDPRKDSTFPGGSGAHRLNDPDTWEPSTNPGLHALNFALGYVSPEGLLVGGIGAHPRGVHFPAFIELANVCDANGWEVSAVVTSTDDKHQQLLGILQAGGAEYAELAGRISCIARTPRTPVATIRARDTAGPFRIDVHADRLVRRNTLNIRCVSEADHWQMTAQQTLKVAEYVTADGGELAAPLDLPFVAVRANNANKDQPAQLGAYALIETRKTLVGTVPFQPHLGAVEPGDLMVIDEPGFLLDGAIVQCRHREFDVMGRTVSITFAGEAPGEHDFALGRTQTPPVPDTLTPGDPNFVPTPSTDDWTATGGSIGNPGFVEGPVITLDGDVADLTGVTHIIVDYRATGDTGWVHHGEFPLAGFEREQILGLLPNAEYDVRLRYRNAWGVIDDAAERVLAGIETGSQVSASALDAAPGSDLDQRVAEADRLAETLMDDALTAREASVARAAAARQLTEQEVGAALDALNLVLGIDATRLAEALGDFAGEFITFEQEITGEVNARATVEQVNAAVANEAEARAVALNALSVNFSASLANQQSQINARATTVQLNQAIANEQSARASAVNGLRAEFEGEFATLASLTYVDEAVADETSARSTAIANLQAQINALDPEGDLDLSGFASITFVNETKADIFAASASSFTGLTATFSSLQSQIDSRATITALNQAKSDIYGSAVSQFTQINAQFSAQQTAINNRATVTQLTQAVADEASARATADQTLQASITGLQGQVDARATITFVNEAKADIFGAAVSAFSQINARFSTTDTAINNRATITQLDTAKSDIFGAAVSQFTQIEARFSALQDDVDSAASITFVNEAVADEASARASAVANLQAQINALDPEGDIDLSGFASITYVDNAVAGVLGASASSFTGLTATFSSLQSQIDNRATITQLNTAKSDIYGSAVSAFTNINAQFSAQQSQINSRATLTQLNEAKADIYGSAVSQFTQINAQFSSQQSQINTRATTTQLNQAVADVLGASVNQFSEISARFNSVEGDLEGRATITQLANVTATLDERTAAFLTQLQAGAAFAGLSLFARDSNGDPTSNIRLAAQIIAFGPDFDTPRFVIDMLGNEVYGLNAAGTVKTFQLGLDNGRVRLRSGDGTLLFDTGDGGLKVLPPELVIPWTVSYANVSGSASGFAASGAVSAQAPVPNLGTGGVAPYTYSWMQIGQISGPTPSISNDAIQRPTFNATVTDGAPSVSTWQVKVTDSVGKTAMANVRVSLLWTNLS